MMKWGDRADDYVKEHGRLDAGFNKIIRQEIAAGRIQNAVPQSKKSEPTKHSSGRCFLLFELGKCLQVMLADLVFQPLLGEAKPCRLRLSGSRWK